MKIIPSLGKRLVCLALNSSLLLLLFMISGCKYQLEPGFYSGNLWINSVGEVPNTSEEPVKVEVTKSKGLFSLHVYRIDGSSILQPITLLNRKEIKSQKGHPHISMPDLAPEPFVMDVSSTDQKLCFSSQAQYAIELCFDEDHLSFEVFKQGTPRIVFMGRRFEQQGEIQMPELPKNPSVIDLVKVALESNGDLLQEKQTMIQANQKAKRAYLSLLPHFSFTPMLNAGVGEICGIVESMSGFVPFLVPSKYIDAKAAKLQARAALMANSILKLNVVNSVHLMAIDHHFQELLFRDLFELRSQVAHVLSSMEKAEGAGGESHLDIEAIQVLVDSLDITMRQIDDRLDDSSTSLANTLGLNHHATLQEITMGSETPPFEDLPILSDAELDAEKEKLSLMAFMNSYEIRQQQILKQSARLNEKLVYLNWIGNDDEMPLGFNLIAESRIASSVTMALTLKIDSIRKSLKVNTEHLLQERNEWRSYLALTHRALEIRQKRWSRFFRNILDTEKFPSPGVDGQMEKAKHLIEDMIEGLTTYHATSAIISMKQAELDRITVQGMYRSLLQDLLQVI